MSSLTQQQWAQRFQSIFKVEMAPYWRPIFRFDLLKFDEEVVHSKPEESMENTIREKWGQEAVDLIWELLGGRR